MHEEQLGITPRPHNYDSVVWLYRDCVGTMMTTTHLVARTINSGLGAAYRDRGEGEESDGEAAQYG